MVVRDFVKEDIDDVLECAKESFVEEFEVEGFDPDKWKKLVRWRFSIFGKILFAFFRLLDREPAKFLVADVNGKVVGTTIVTQLRNIGYIQTVMVHPDFRRKGIASELMKTAIQYIHRKKFTKAILHVSATNDSAKKLYQKLGFQRFDDIVYLTADVCSLNILESTEGIHVREFNKSDADAVYELIKRSRDPEVFSTYDLQKTDLRRSFWERIVRMSNTKKIVAVKDGKLVGYASLSYTSSKEAGRIRNIDVYPETASQGVEEGLIRTGVDFISSSGTKTILITVPATKGKSIERLKELGFKKRFSTEGMVLQ